MKQVIIYTDGAAKGNPGPGGFGVVMMYGTHRKEISQGFRHTTNNRMELLSVIVGLEALTKAPLPVTVYSDSKYVVDAVEKGWLFGWEKTAPINLSFFKSDWNSSVPCPSAVFWEIPSGYFQLISHFSG